MAIEMVFESKARATLAARVILLFVPFEMLLHVKSVFVHVEKRLIAKRANLNDLLDVHELMHLLLDFAGGILAANEAGEGGFVGI